MNVKSTSKNKSQRVTIGALVRDRKTPGTLLFIAFFIYVAIPLLWIVMNSMKSNASLFTSFGFWFDESPQLMTNVKAVLNQDEGIFSIWMRNTFIYAAAAAVGASIASTLAGYAFAVFEFKGKTQLLSGILLTIMIPNTALAVPLFQVMTNLGIINTPWAMILPSIVSPFGVFLMYSYIKQSLPIDLIDAGRVDGASELGILTKIVLPIVSPGIATVFLFVFVGTWNNFFLPLLVLTKPTLQPVTVGLAGWNAQAQSPGISDVLFTQVITGALMSIIPLILAFLMLQRYWRAGLTVGAVK